MSDSQIVLMLLRACSRFRLLNTFSVSIKCPAQGSRRATFSQSARDDSSLLCRKIQNYPEEYPKNSKTFLNQKNTLSKKVARSAEKPSFFFTVIEQTFISAT